MLMLGLRETWSERLETTFQKKKKMGKAPPPLGSCLTTLILVMYRFCIAPWPYKTIGETGIVPE